MNCTEWQNLILLDDAGELTADKRPPLAEHIAACEACRTYRHDLRAAGNLARRHLPADGPAAAVMQNLRREAIRACPANCRATPRILRFNPRIVTALSYAAALMVMVAGWFLLRTPDGTPNTPATVATTAAAPRMEDVETAAALLAIAATEDDPEMTGFDDSLSRDDRVRALARELLTLQGLDADDLMI